MLKSTGCPSGGPSFDSLLTHGSSQPSVSSCRASDALFGPRGHCMCGTHIHPLSQAEKLIKENKYLVIAFVRHFVPTTRGVLRSPELTLHIHSVASEHLWSPQCVSFLILYSAHFTPSFLMSLSLDKESIFGYLDFTCSFTLVQEGKRCPCHPMLAEAGVYAHLIGTLWFGCSWDYLMALIKIQMICPAMWGLGHSKNPSRCELHWPLSP